jgi:hypothetical protein
MDDNKMDDKDLTPEEQDYKRLHMRLKVDPRRTICEIHREIYDIVDEHLKDQPYFDSLVAKLEECYFIAKKMDAKLMQYKFNYNKDWYENETKERHKEKLALRSKRKV